MKRSSLLVCLPILLALLSGACSDDTQTVGGETAIQCNDGKDNDEDGKTDCADEDCIPICGDASTVPRDGGPVGDQGVPQSCDCDDGFPCTRDSCVNGVCHNTVIDSWCLIDSFCRQKGQKSGCKVCDPDKDKQDWTPIIGGCTVGSTCYAKGETDASGCMVCTPSKSVTTLTNVVDPDCTVGGKCYKNGETDATGCQVCDPVQSKTSLNAAKYDCKVANMCYSKGDKHPSLTCSNVVCDPAVSSQWTVKGNECLYGNTCYAAGKRAMNGCMVCNPSQSKTTLSPSAYDCKIGNGCYQDAEVHHSLTCTSTVCDKATSTTEWTVKGNECLIGDYCRQPGNRTSNGCQECTPSESKTAWSPSTNHCNINGSCYKDGDKHPSTVCTTVVCKASSPSKWTITGAECLIGNTCYKQGDKSGSNNCLECNPTLVKTDWSPAASNCKIGGVCYQSGDKHPSSSCTTTACDSTANPLDWTVKGNECLIDNACYANGAANTAVTCTTATCNTAVSKTSWTVAGNECLIANTCYVSGATDLTGCWTCNPAKSKTQWTAATSCSKIVLSALNEGHQGNLGGIAGANAMCASQAAAAGFPGTWKAFLSSSAQNVKNLVPAAKATSIPVVNTKGQQLFTSWNAIFPSTYWSSSYYIYAFAGHRVDENQATPDYYHGRGWHGSTTSGLVYANYTCNNWTSSSSSHYGYGSEWDSRRLVYIPYNNSCSYYLAVGCIQIP
jgi:hypothetical protein